MGDECEEKKGKDQINASHREKFNIIWESNSGLLPSS